MLKLRTIFFLGIWVSILPFLGFPMFWKNMFFILSGVILLIVSYLLYKEKSRNSPLSNTKYQSFSEARPDKDIIKDTSNDIPEPKDESSFNDNEFKERSMERKKMYRPARIHAIKESTSHVDNVLNSENSNF